MGDRCLSGLGLKKDVKFGQIAQFGRDCTVELIRAEPQEQQICQVSELGWYVAAYLVSPSSRITKLERLPISGGMSPPRRLRLRSKILRLASFPKFGWN